VPVKEVNYSAAVAALQAKADACPSGHEILMECLDLADLLLDKNKKYGDSALKPKRIFSRASVVDQIDIRIDDKLSRIENRADDEDEDPTKDILGYLILRRIAERRAKLAGMAP
jgi:hypothetical protein